MTKHLTQGRLTYLPKKDISFNGVKMNKTLWYAVNGLMEKTDGAVVAVLQSIQKEFGKETLTKTYSKIYAICRIVKSQAARYECTEKALFLYVLEGLRFKLRSGEIKAVDVKIETFESCPKKGKRGLVDVFIAVKAICANIFL